MRAAKANSTLSSLLFPLLLTYSLLLSTVAPFVVRKVNAADKKPVTAPSKAAMAQTKSGRRDGEVLVRFRDGVSLKDKQALVTSLGATSTRRLRGSSSAYQISLPAGQVPEAAAAQLLLNPIIQMAEPNYLISQDQMGTNNILSTKESLLRVRPQAAAKPGTSISALQTAQASTSTVIAVIDSGIDFTNPDLISHQWKNTRESANGRDDDRNGFIDDTSGFSWVSGGKADEDDAGHGTRVAGVIVGANNAGGTDANAISLSLMSLRVLDSTGTGDIASAVEAIDYAVMMGASVINCSWGTDENSALLREAIVRAGKQGVIVVASAGNLSHDIESAPYYPASYGLSNVLVVASTGNDGSLSSWSNWGISHVQVAAPGDSILTTARGGSYEAITGTSASAALASRVAGLVKTERPFLSAERTREVIVAGATPVASLKDKVSSGSVIDATGTMLQVNALPPNEGKEKNTDSGNGQGGNNGGGSTGNGNGTINPMLAATPERVNRTQGAPGVNLPNLDVIRNQRPVDPKTPDPVPSTRRRCPPENPNCGDIKAPENPKGVSSYIPPDNSVKQYSPVFFASIANDWWRDLFRLSSVLESPIPSSPPPSAPTNLTDTSVAATQVQLNWDTASGADHYQIERRQNITEGYQIIATSTSTNYTDTNVIENKTYIYRVRAIDTIGSPSAPSNTRIATTVTFTDNPLKDPQNPSNTVPIKKDHIMQLRSAVNAVRAAAGKAPATWTYALSEEHPLIHHEDIEDLRSNVDEALRAFGFTPPTYIDASLAGQFIKREHIQQLREAVNWGGTETGASGGADFNAARLDPINRTGESGEDLLSGNYNWSLPIVSLPGRAGLDLGLSLSYNSLVWTKSGTSIAFDADHGFPSPGFRLGFPVIQGRFMNAQGAASYLMITPSGSRVELRNTALNTYESADSSYLQLTESGSDPIVRTTDGTQLWYHLYGADYQCIKIMDRDGNYITTTYNSAGRITSVTDTLGRVITFNYDSFQNLSTITQDWRRDLSTGSVQETHTWASFGWDNITINTGFNGMAQVGAQNNQTIPVIKWVGLPDSSSYIFSYNSLGQVTTISHNAGPNNTGRTLATTTYTLSNGTGCAGTYDSNDVPRVCKRDDAAENWIGATTSFSTDLTHSWGQVTLPDGTVYKELFATTGWQRGLTTGTEFWSSGVKKKWTTSSWTQDDESLTYQKNPRVTESNIYDDGGNRRRTRVSYTSYGLPSDVYEYQSDAVNVLRRTHTDYKIDQTADAAYLNLRIIGLVKSRKVYDGNNDDNDSNDILYSSIEYRYDEPDETNLQLLTSAGTTTQQDSAYNGTSIRQGRALVTSVRRINAQNSSDVSVTRIGYNTTGTVAFTRDVLGHQVSISYGDSFSDGVNHNTAAYPTTMTDADGFQSFVKYNYSFGAVTRTEGPPPQNQSQGAIQTMDYDAAGRIQKVINQNNNAYTRFVYDASQTFVSTLSTIKDINTEAFSGTSFDGAGRLRSTQAELPGSTGGYVAQTTSYDAMGRPSGKTNPTEINGSWIPSGDDAAGWVWTNQSYDWKGRPTVTTNPDLTTKQISYGGCGCAGGEIVTITGETLAQGNRQQKIYHDVLGREVKTESLNWDSSVYSAVVTSYNVRDQVTNVRQYAGAEGSATYQDTIIGYDGHGRVQSKKVPAATNATTYSYYADDLVHVITDGRGATQTLSYNNRHRVAGVTYGAPQGSNINVPGNVSFSYDAAGNRTAMTDGSGSTSYQYNSLSQLLSETHTFNGLTGSFTLSYSYNPGGELTSITDPFGYAINYTYDRIGRLQNVTGTTYAGVTDYASGAQYRAWGALKSVSYGGHDVSIGYNSRLQVSSYAASGMMSKQYQYYADGSLRYSHEVLDSRLDRFYQYDHMGRITQALSGAEARGETLTDERQRPYNETFSYDQMSHLTARTTHYWDQVYSMTDSYLNDRNTSQIYNYDAAGNMLNNPDTFYSYDAGGRIDSVSMDSSTAQTFDGDGVRVKTVEAIYDEQTLQQRIETKYYVASSVLRGEIISEVSDTGTKQRTYVYAGGQLLAWQMTHPGGTSGPYNAVVWEYREPSNASVRFQDNTSAGVEEQELDPLGANAEAYPPLIYNPPPDDGNGGSLLGYPNAGIPSQMGVSYSRDGIPISADEAIRLLHNTPSGAGFALLFADAAHSQEDYDQLPIERTPARSSLVPAALHPESNDNPQDSMQIPLGGTNKLKNLLESTSSACKEAIKNLIEKIASIKNEEAYSTDIMDLFNMMTSQTGGGGVYVDVSKAEMDKYLPKVAMDELRRQGDVPGGSGLSWSFKSSAGPQRISVVFLKGGIFKNTPKTIVQKELLRKPFDYLVTAIHELIHKATKNPYAAYDHPEMNQAAQLLGAKNLDDYIEKHCIPRQFWSLP